MTIHEQTVYRFDGKKKRFINVENSFELEKSNSINTRGLEIYNELLFLEDVFQDVSIHLVTRDTDHFFNITVSHSDLGVRSFYEFYSDSDIILTGEKGDISKFILLDFTKRYLQLFNQKREILNVY